MVGANTNKRKSDQLGIPYGTASHRLRQQLFFGLLSQAELNVCFVCGKMIETSDQMSIEHKEPWLDVDPALFWDLDNIAYSHRKCNRPQRLYRGGYTGVKHQCGTSGGYRNGCRCDECRKWKSDDNKKWNKRRKPRPRSSR